MFENNYNNGEYQGSFTTETPLNKTKKTHGAAKVIALIAAVAVIGGGAGFGGAFIAGRMSNNLTDPVYSSPVYNSAPHSSEVSTPTLNELQSDTVSHNISTSAERNSDGTYAYTRDLVAAVRDSIVYVTVYINYGGQSVAYSSGSGIIISDNGYILTNAHVVTDFKYNYDIDKYIVSVTTTDPSNGTGVAQEYEAKLIGSDKDTDLAIIKIEAAGLPKAVLGDSDELHLGDDVVAIGNPLGLETSVSKGVVSGLNRQISSSERSLSSIQTDTAINEGNSGGALFNMYGEVVGVVNQKYVDDYAENIGFAITINEAKNVIDDLISKGYVTGRPILGITCVQVSEYVAELRGLIPGLLVTDIEQGMAIAQSELVVGDTITEINGKSVLTVDDVSEIIKDMKPGDSVTVTVVRTDSLGREKQVKFDIILSEYVGN